MPICIFFYLQPQTLVEAVHSSLRLDGESVYSLVVNPFLLLLARVILTKCSPKMDSLQVRVSFCHNHRFLNYMCARVCVHVRVRVCVCVYVHACMRACVCIYMCISICMCKVL